MRLPLLALLALLPAAPLFADWPQWRGPRGDGASPEASAPIRWSKTENVEWSVELPGEGHASPIVQGDSVFTVTALDGGHDRALVRIDAGSGRILWVKTAVRTEKLEPLHGQNSFASSTPATDGERVVTSFHADGRAAISCFDYTGGRLWEIRPVAFAAGHGYGYSPVIDGDRVFVSIQQEAEPVVLALDKVTGKELWRTACAGRKGSYSTPILVEAGKRRTLFNTGGNETRALDPETGKVLWASPGPTDYCVANVAYGSGILLTNGGYPDKIARAYHAEGPRAGQVAWETKKGSSYVPSPLYQDGHFYQVVDGGIAYCFEAATGKVKWQKRLPGNYRTSLTFAAGNLYTTNDEGTTTVFKASPEGCEIVAENKLDEFTYASPAFSGGRIYLRTKTRLYRCGP